MKNIHTKFNEILQCLNQDESKSGKASLISGDIGIILFNLHTYEHTKDESIYEKAVEQIEELIENTVIEDAHYTFCSGIAGFGIFIEYIEQKGWLEIDTNELLGDIDEYLYQNMMSAIEMGNYDFLHGAIGVGFYFIYRSRKTTTVKKYVEDLVLALEDLAIIEEDGSMKWQNYNFDNSCSVKGEYNLGLAHGIPSFLSFLVKVHQEGISPEKTLDMISSTSKYILKTQFKLSENYSTFPFTVANNPKDEINDSRLAWCYGDLGVCCSLWQAAKLLNDNFIEQEVLKIILNAASKRTIEQTRITDAGICHGAAGAAFIFQRFYDWTQEPMLKKAADYWYDITVNMDTFEDGYVGYKTYYTPDLGGSRASYNILDGISGIGLTFLYRISDIDPSWEELLFIR